jgi:hypothetical protein
MHHLGRRAVNPRSRDAPRVMSVAIYSAIDGNGTEISRFGAFRGSCTQGYPPILGIANAFSEFASLLSAPRPFNELALQFSRRQALQMFCSRLVLLLFAGRPIP